MTESRVQQTLQKIEDDLAKLESARTQVNQLTNQTEQLMQAVSGLVSNVSRFHEDLIDDKGVLKRSMGTFERNLITTSDNFSKKAGELSVKQEQVSSKLLENTKQLQEQIEQTQSKIERFDVDKGFSQVFDEVLLLKKIVSDYLGVQNKGFQELESQLKKHSDEQIESTEQLRGEMEQTQSILKSFDVEKGFSQINNQVLFLKKSVGDYMEVQNNGFQELGNQFKKHAAEQKQSANRNLLFIISGFLILSIILAAIYFV